MKPLLLEFDNNWDHFVTFLVLFFDCDKCRARTQLIFYFEPKIRENDTMEQLFFVTNSSRELGYKNGKNPGEMKHGTYIEDVVININIPNVWNPPVYAPLLGA